MKLIKGYKVPTDEIFVMEESKGQLEILSLGDYGKNVNFIQSFRKEK